VIGARQTVPAEPAAPIAVPAGDDLRTAPVSNQALLAKTGFVEQLGPGQPLDGHTRQRMESAFGANFSGVQVHAGPEAHQAVRRQSAQAFTVGNHVAFASGNYRPGTPVGDALLAHELAHTLQQGSPPAELGTPATGGAGTALEGDAERAATGVMLRLWGRAAGVETAGFRDTRPALRSALQVQRCACGGAPPPVAAVEPMLFESRNVAAGVSRGLRTENEGPDNNLRLRTYRYLAMADVVAMGGGSDADAPNWEAGYTQTAFDGLRLHNYREIATGTPMARERIEVSEPSLDGGFDTARPWYAPPSTFATSLARVHVEMDDTPGDRAHWQDEGHQVELVSTGGQDHYCSWLIVKHHSSDEPIYLNWDTWEVNWSSTVDPAHHTATPAGDAGAQVTDRGTGQGPHTPMLRGRFFNDKLNDMGHHHVDAWDGTS
jgi:hypothetical protein